jgi:hypothetical protein
MYSKISVNIRKYPKVSINIRSIRKYPKISKSIYKYLKISENIMLAYFREKQQKRLRRASFLHLFLLRYLPN